MLTQTWRHRLTASSTSVRRAAATVAVASCAIVAVNTLWGAMFDHPLDVTGPARTAVNRTALVGSFGQDCVSRWLTATASRQQSLRDCFALPDPPPLPTTPAVVIGSPAVAAITLATDTGAAQQWSVVIAVSERPYDSAAPHPAFYRIPVLYSRYGLRATALPARVNGPGAGADATLGYPATLAPTSPVFATVAGFFTAYLTGGGGLERYVTADSGLLPAADYRTATVRALLASHTVPDQGTPAEGTHVQVLATVDAVTSQFAPARLDYPLTLVVASRRWSVADIDDAPLLAADTELTPVVAAPTARPR